MRGRFPASKILWGGRRLPEGTLPGGRRRGQLRPAPLLPAGEQDRGKINECFAEAQVVPHAYITSTYTQISTSICYERLAAAFIPHVCLAEQQQTIPGDINIFPLLQNGHPLMQPVNLIHLRDRYLTRSTRYFQDLLSGYLRAVEQVHLERVAETE